MTSDYPQPGFMVSWFSNLSFPYCQAGELLMLAKRSRDKTEQERILRDSLQVGLDFSAIQPFLVSSRNARA